MFTGFNFSGGSGNRYYPAGFSNKTPSDGVAASVSCSYDGTAIPDGGYPFAYTTTAPELGNGSGTIKNGGESIGGRSRRRPLPSAGRRAKPGITTSAKAGSALAVGQISG